VQPLAAGWQFVGFGWEARRNEPGRQGTLQHVPIVRDYSRASHLRASREQSMISSPRTLVFGR
jgi:hypothetical protein